MPYTLVSSVYVALLAEGVDRNNGIRKGIGEVEVALLAEGVDRNTTRIDFLPSSHKVALLAEGVDRNEFILTIQRSEVKSPSSRRAWIEIRSGLSGV